MGNTRTLEISETIQAPVTAVWKALIDKDMIKQYFFGTETESSWQQGSPIVFTGSWEGQKYEDKGTILDIEKNKLLRFSYWSSMSGTEDKLENYVIITYHLTPKQEQTQLTITQDGFRDEETYNHSMQLWQEVLKNLKTLLETSKSVDK